MRHSQMFLFAEDSLLLAKNGFFYGSHYDSYIIGKASSHSEISSSFFKPAHGTEA